MNASTILIFAVMKVFGLNEKFFHAFTVPAVEVMENAKLCSADKPMK